MSGSFNPSPDVPCDATVDRYDMITGAGEWYWRVKVATPTWWPERIRKTYFIPAPSDTLAAQEGIRRFVDEARKAPLIVVH